MPSDFSILKGFLIQIFYFETRKDLNIIAHSIKKQLASYGLTNTDIKSLNPRQVADLHVCPWATIRYEPDEESAAKSLISIVTKAAPKQNWYLSVLEIDRSQGTTDGSISVFVDDESVFKDMHKFFGQKDVETMRGCLKSQEGSQGDNLSMNNLRQNLESNEKSIR
jgi:hypothetical protein